MKKINLLHISVRADIGGAPNYINNMINHLSGDFRVFIACPKDKPYYDIWMNNKKVADIFMLPHRKFSLHSLFFLHKWVKKNKIQIVQANGKGAGVYGRALKILNPKLKIIYAYRGFHYQQYNWFLKKIYFIYERLALKLTDKVINVSKGEQKDCIKKNVLTSDKSIVIYNGIPAKSNSIDLKLKEKYDGFFLIVTLSRFDYQKNMSCQLEIAKALKNHDKIKFLWIGDGPDHGKLEKRAMDEGVKNIEFLGFIDNEKIYNYLSISDIYLSTSKWEGLPFALIEATSMGLPIVATDVIGNNEVCRDGINGVLFGSSELNKAIEHILYFYHNEKEKKSFGKESLKLFNNLFHIGKMINEHDKLYNSLLS